MTRKLKLLFHPRPARGASKTYKGLEHRDDARRHAARAQWALQRAGLTWREGVVVGTGCVALAVCDDAAWYRAGEAQALPLAAFDAVLMRQDPPFDFEYVTATWLLERAAQAGVRVFNDRARCATTRRSRSRFPGSPRPRWWHATSGHPRLHRAELGDVILKPLDGMGGNQIFRVRRRPQPQRDRGDARPRWHSHHHGAAATCRRSSTATSAY